MIHDTLRDLQRRVDRLESESAVVVLRDFDAGGGAGAPPTRVRWGEVVSSTAAGPPVDGCGQVPGSLTAREWVDPPLWAGGVHDTGDVVTLPSAENFGPDADYTAADLVVLDTSVEFDEGADYAEGDLVLYEGALYQADAAITAGAWNAGEWSALSGRGELHQADDAITAGPWDAEEWTLIGTPGDNYCAQTTVAAGPWDAGEWDATEAELILGEDEYELVHHHPFPPASGTSVAWIGSVVVEVEPEDEATDNCGDVEISNMGGLAVRFTGDTCTGAWHTIPSVACNDGVVELPPEESPS